MKTYSMIMDRVYWILSHLLTLLLGLLVAIVTLQIAGRLLPMIPYMLWTEEIARFLLSWLVFVGATVGVRDHSHFLVDVFPPVKSKVVQIIWDILIIVGMAIVTGIFAIRGFKYAMVLVYDVSDIAQIPMIWVGASIPAFGIISIFFLLEQIFKTFTSKGEV
jgi:TRAP-type transport system small permease protein